jgi:hypothetical protein
MPCFLKQSSALDSFQKLMFGKAATKQVLGVSRIVRPMAGVLGKLKPAGESNNRR